MMTMRREVETWPEMEAIAKKMVEELETESSGSSEAETESPRSVGRWVAAPITATTGRVHSQVLKIREEDLCVLVEDKAANPENRRYVLPRRLDLFLISRPNLPCSPLSGKVRSVNAVQ
ncbi:LOW QUALITY PROTEIN: uncharacterized protein LOC18017964 [Eutrema salsugineum]|uniref:LOW QUALITY PROTEIN: uncharacterized protein LOC18017964 n=1 Tax=Eutrema salsugineum TaxID=72664 RepID=UPI000CED1CD0|nr:LOW QUALITY PROTEIN: uncharacterized protein LOC18017964 [Eutrema salsugineum]